MKIWTVHLRIVSSKKTPDYWEDWANYYVVAETIEEAVQKTLDYEKASFYKVAVDKTELLCEVDIE